MNTHWINPWKSLTVWIWSKGAWRASLTSSTPAVKNHKLYMYVVLDGSQPILTRSPWLIVRTWCTIQRWVRLSVIKMWVIVCMGWRQLDHTCTIMQLAIIFWHNTAGMYTAILPRYMSELLVFFHKMHLLARSLLTFDDKRLLAMRFVFFHRSIKPHPLTLSRVCSLDCLDQGGRGAKEEMRLNSSPCNTRAMTYPERPGAWMTSTGIYRASCTRAYHLSLYSEKLSAHMEIFRFSQ